MSTLLPDPLFSDSALIAASALQSVSEDCYTLFFPAECKKLGNNLRISDSESIRNWFKRVVETLENEGHKKDHWRLNNRLAFFASVRWEEGALLECSIQALVIEGCKNFEEYFFEETKGITEFYYRLDLHPQQPGKLFAEQFPHLHHRPKHEPRFPFSLKESEFVVITFLEFLYLNHFHPEWRSWAKKTCGLLSPKADFDWIDQVFKDGKALDYLKAENDVDSPSFDDQLQKIKTSLKRAKADLCRKSFRIDDRILDLNY